jgi:hypothetical protein
MFAHHDALLPLTQDARPRHAKIVALRVSATARSNMRGPPAALLITPSKAPFQLTLEDFTAMKCIVVVPPPPHTNLAKMSPHLAPCYTTVLTIL